MHRPGILLGIALILFNTPLGFAQPVPVAHRGLAGYAPENTRAAFQACLALRLGFELDIRRIRSGELVVIHDDSVNRTTDGQGQVADLSLKQLQGLDAGRWFHPDFAGERVPTLAQVFELCRHEKLEPRLIALDLKSFDESLATDLAKLVREFSLRDRVVCIGLAIKDPAVRKSLKAADPRLPVAVLAQTRDDLKSALDDPLADWVYVRFLPTSEQVAAARKAGKWIIAAGSQYSGRKVEHWQAAARAGVDAILTDYPLELRQATK
jgi:glycerophosphoryl diester phosphodiesterase